jgi:hypothetical protein
VCVCVCVVLGMRRGGRQHPKGGKSNERTVWGKCVCLPYTLPRTHTTHHTPHAPPQMQAIKRVQGLIQRAQGTMRSTKHSYEAAVQARNATGVPQCWCALDAPRPQERALSWHAALLTWHSTPPTALCLPHTHTHTVWQV